MELPQRFSQLYQRLNSEQIALLPTIYASDIRFTDPVTSHNGLASVTEYFSDLLQNTLECHFDITYQDWQADKAHIAWTMSYKHKRLNPTQAIEVNGFTKLELKDDRIVRHRDYFDLGQMLYEHVPLVGRCIRWLKRRLSQ